MLFKVSLLISIASLVHLLPLKKQEEQKPPYKFPNDNPELGEYFQGDIMGIQVDERGAVAHEAFLVPRWTNGVIPYGFDPTAEYTQQEIDVIHSGMKHIEDLTRVNGKYCIKFVPRTTEEKWIEIYNGPGCASHLGMQPPLLLWILGQEHQRLSLQRPLPGNVGSKGFITLGVVAHEFMHALGIWHEQSRPDRDDYVDIFWQNLIPGAIPQYMKYDETLVNATFTPYDYGSLMHYEWNAFTANGGPIILPKDGDKHKIGNRQGMSPIDITEIRNMYNCF